MKKTLIIGASSNPQRYSYQCIKSLRKKHIETVAIARKEGSVDDVIFSTKPEQYTDIHTIAIYLAPKHQAMYQDYIATLKPERVIFPPGSENTELEEFLNQKTIRHERACPLVMLSIGSY